MVRPWGERPFRSTSIIMGASRTASLGMIGEPTHAQRRRAILASTPAPGPDGQHDERAIVDAVLAGDREAFRLLVERESASVVRAGHRILGDLNEAEDVAQEAFVTAYRSLASWRGDGPFGAWLTRIAVRLALRRLGQRKSVPWLDATAPTAEGVEGSDLSTGPRSDPAAIVMRAERAT